MNKFFASLPAEFHRYFDFRDQRRPIVDHNFQHADGMSAPANDSEVSESGLSLKFILQRLKFLRQALSATSTADTNSNSTEQEAALDSTSETTPITPGILKLEDYDEITFEPSVVEANRVRREAGWNEDVSNRGLRVGDDDAIDSTTVESSTMPMAALQEQEASDNSFATLSPPAVATSQHHNFYYIPSYEKFPYPPSQVPAAQHVSITHPPHHRPYLPPVKNYYDFYPSQPDYNYSPYCMNSIHHKFTPVAHDAWLNYRKWK